MTTWDFTRKKWRFKPQDHDFAGNNGDSHLKMVVSIKPWGFSLPKWCLVQQNWGLPSGKSTK